jgi:hypothetical protein
MSAQNLSFVFLATLIIPRSAGALAGEPVRLGPLSAQAGEAVSGYLEIKPFNDSGPGFRYPSFAAHRKGLPWR